MANVKLVNGKYASNASFPFDVEQARNSSYVPINIEPSVLHSIEKELAPRRPALRVKALVADFLTPFSLPRVADAKTLIAFFCGTTTGQQQPLGSYPRCTKFDSG